MKRCTAKSTREWMVHGVRVAAFVAILVLIRLQHREFIAARPSGGEQPPMERVRRIFPDAHSVRTTDNAGIWDVLDGEGTRLGGVLQTSPDSDPIIGFSGPSNLLIGFDVGGRIAGLEVVSSRDTPEHVGQVVNDPKFLRSFNGLIWREAAARPNVDAVSGATLTSLAMAEGVQRRLGGKPASLKFTDPVRLDDIRLIFSTAQTIVADPGDPSVVRVSDAQSSSLGWILRTSPAADSLIGYQGPTDALIGFDVAGRVAGVAIGKSYDNEPYVRYVREDDAFRTLFKGQTISEIAGFDLKAAEVEGVAGATMTSMAVAKGVILAAERKQAVAQPSAPRKEAWPWSDLGTAAVILAGIAIGFTNLRGIGWVRIAYQLVVLGYLGLINGALLSQAQLVGWAQSGVPRGAWGLVLLTAAALSLPIATKRNLYCTHLCPHGALQQLALRVARPRRKAPSRLRGVLLAIPAVLLLVCLVVAMTHWPFCLVNIEPFDAYVVRIAGGAALAIAVVGAVAACFVPMAYCRYGCPTGALLEFLRRSSRSDRIALRDGIAAAFVAGAIALWLAR